MSEQGPTGKSGTPAVGRGVGTEHSQGLLVTYHTHMPLFLPFCTSPCADPRTHSLAHHQATPPPPPHFLLPTPPPRKKRPETGRRKKQQCRQRGKYSLSLRRPCWWLPDKNAHGHSSPPPPTPAPCLPLQLSYPGAKCLLSGESPLQAAWEA